MRRRPWAGGALCLALAACGAQERVGNAETWRARADQAFQARQFDDAARGYQHAFCLLDPEPAQAQDRALLAFRCARARAEAASADLGDWPPEIQAREALAWLEQALALAPSLRQVHFERARLLDAPGAPWRDEQAALEAYRAYVVAVEAAADVPDSERERVALARARLEQAAPR